MVSFRGQKKLGPCPDQSPLGVQFKISEEHPLPPLGVFRGTCWAMSCHYKNARKCLLYICHAAIHEHVGFQHMGIFLCVDTADYERERKHSLLLTPLNCI